MGQMHVKPGFTGQNGIIPTDSWIMTCDTLFDCIFWGDSEYVINLVTFGQIMGQKHVKPSFTGQKWQNPHRFMDYDIWLLGTFSLNSWSDNKTITSFHLIKSWTMIHDEYLFLLINLTIFNEEMWKRLAIVKKPRALINQRAFLINFPL